MDKQEKIVCAAIEFTTEDLFISTQQDKYVLCGVGYEEIKNFNNSVICREVLHTQNGFITSKNRFVDAKEAMKIAVEENQIEAIRKVFDAIPNFHDKGIDSHEFGEAANAAIDIRDEYLARELKPEDLY